jgi:hypothetical protein
MRLQISDKLHGPYVAPALRMSYQLHRVRRTAGRPNEVPNSMMKTLTTLTAAATVAAALLAAPSDANAQRRWGPAVGLGILGGVAAGAIVGSAIANSWGPAYVVQPGYAVYPGYGAGAPVGCPGGYWARVPVYDGYGNVIGWRGRPRFFCP